MQQRAWQLASTGISIAFSESFGSPSSSDFFRRHHAENNNRYSSSSHLHRQPPAGLSEQRIVVSTLPVSAGIRRSSHDHQQNVPSQFPLAKVERFPKISPHLVLGEQRDVYLVSYGSTVKRGYQANRMAYILVHFNGIDLI